MAYDIKWVCNAVGAHRTCRMLSWLNKLSHYYNDATMLNESLVICKYILHQIRNLIYILQLKNPMLCIIIIIPGGIDTVVKKKKDFFPLCSLYKSHLWAVSQRGLLLYAQIHSYHGFISTLFIFQIVTKCSSIYNSFYSVLMKYYKSYILSWTYYLYKNSLQGPVWFYPTTIIALRLQ